MKKLHIVCFQNPYPANYGGVIDVYYKLKALKDAGYYIMLHIYIYNRPKSEDELLKVADEVYYYTRKTGVLSQLSCLPYIVKSRSSNELLNNLLRDKEPILFEGLHTCAFLGDKRLESRNKIVRMHNIEHKYYNYLANSTANPVKKIFYKVESFRLEKFERVLNYASSILPISSVEEEYFNNKYPNTNVVFLQGYFENETCDEIPGKGDYILYHGNLSVEENIKSAQYIIRNIVPKLADKEFVIAGANPPEYFISEIKKYKNIKLIANPEKDMMDSLIIGARINLLITFQNTGLKLKLLNSLSKGGMCIVNRDMIAGSGVVSQCIVANNTDEIIEAIKSNFPKEFTIVDKSKRVDFLNSYISGNKTEEVFNSIL